MRFSNKVAVITGSGSGIGRATALRFASEGAKVVVSDIDTAGGEETVNMIKKNGGEAFFINVNVTKESDIEEMVKTTVNQYGSLNIIFNNAGYEGPIKVLHE